MCNKYAYDSKSHMLTSPIQILTPGITSLSLCLGKLSKAQSTHLKLSNVFYKNNFFGSFFIQYVLYILKQLFTTVLVKMVDIYRPAITIRATYYSRTT